jgi:aryl-alcohol dehydrogenase-like predicted oxidoreductase
MPEPYKEENYTYSIKEPVAEAVRNGANMIDTAANYRYRMSEREIGEALESLDAEGFTREELIIASKAGFIPLDFPFPKDPYVWINETLIDGGLATKEEIIADQHCLSPGFLRWSVEESLKNLGVETLDILYLHNPETQLGYVSPEVLNSRIEAAFALFETLADEGKIKAYGIASWNGFLYEESDMEYLGLSGMIALAKKAGGDAHRFRHLQLPYNLAKTDAYAYPNQKGPDGKYYTVLQLAQAYGLNVVGSSALLQMNLFKKPLAATVTQLLGVPEMTDIQHALQFARSAKGIVSALFASTSPAHVRENLLLGHVPRCAAQNYQKLFGFSHVV